MEHRRYGTQSVHEAKEEKKNNVFHYLIFKEEKTFLSFRTYVFYAIVYE